MIRTVFYDSNGQPEDQAKPFTVALCTRAFCRCSRILNYRQRNGVLAYESAHQVLCAVQAVVRYNDLVLGPQLPLCIPL